MRRMLVTVAAGVLGALGLAGGGATAQSPYCAADAKVSFARVQLWVDPNCQGGSMIVPTDGNGDRPDFTRFTNFDGKTYNVDNTRSSLALAPNTCARVFDGTNYTGEESNLLCATGSTAYFGLFKFDNRVSSMRVCRSDRQYQCTRTGTDGAPPPQPASPPSGPAPAGPGAPVDALRHDSTGTKCARGPQPGAIAVRDWLKRNVPGSSFGIYNCRNVRGGSSLSLHAEGRAVDWKVTTANGNALVSRLLASEGPERWALARRMGAQEVIFNRRIWTAKRAGEGLRRYTGSNPHTDHVHIGLHWGGALKQTSFYGASAPAPSPPPSTNAPAPSGQPEGPHPLRYVALGDSYTSGVGLPPFVAGGEGCGRSTRAYPRLFRFGPQAPDVKFFACGGAISDDFDLRVQKHAGMKQLDRPELNQGIELVTVMIGGNDVKFSEVVRNCGLGLCTRASQTDENTYRRIRDELPGKLDRVYRKLKDKVSADTVVVVIGYPQIFPTGRRRFCNSLQPLFQRTEQNFMRDATYKMRDQIARAAQRHGFHFLDAIPYFKDHEVCGSAADWLNAIVGNPKSPEDNSFHPQLDGHAGYAHALEDFLRRKLDAGAPRTPAGLPRNPAPAG
jgi:lysophospholipase L1-like esterase